MTPSHHAGDTPAGDPPHLQPVPAELDAVVRRRAFEAVHPDVTISPPETHASLWKARRAGKILATGYHLGDLMDALDLLFGDEP